ncbi:hypothetical protein, partial [Candidatus Methylacidithermus pantelleriae]|uniref:hypothetical protein n=1 Tax=Candidatus Methylacidithermus pantelleriae TaxID=2744239 RepID=UPI00157BD897
MNTYENLPPIEIARELYEAYWDAQRTTTKLTAFRKLLSIWREHDHRQIYDYCLQCAQDIVQKIRSGRKDPAERVALNAALLQFQRISQSYIRKKTRAERFQTAAKAFTPPHLHSQEVHQTVTDSLRQIPSSPEEPIEQTESVEADY